MQYVERFEVNKGHFVSTAPRDASVLSNALIHAVSMVIGACIRRADAPMLESMAAGLSGGQMRKILWHEVRQFYGLDTFDSDYSAEVKVFSDCVDALIHDGYVAGAIAARRGH